MAIIEEETTSTTQKSSKPQSTVRERLDEALKLKQEGNQFWESKEEKKALEKWHSSLLFSSGINSFSTMFNGSSTEEENKIAERLTCDVHNNLSAYYISKGLYSKAVQSSSKVLSLTPNSLKALYRLGLANLRLGNLQEAAIHLGKAMDYAPNDQKIRALCEELVQATEKLDAERKRDAPK